MSKYVEGYLKKSESGHLQLEDKTFYCGSSISVIRADKSVFETRIEHTDGNYYVYPYKDTDPLDLFVRIKIED